MIRFATPGLLDTILADARIDASRERCGLLLGRRGDAEAERGGIVTEVRPLRNVSREPERAFEIDPAELHRAHREEAGGGVALLGVWHTHPGGSPAPSVLDSPPGGDEALLLVVVPDGSLSAWRWREGRYEPERMEVGGARGGGARNPL